MDAADDSDAEWRARHGAHDGQPGRDRRDARTDAGHVVTVLERRPRRLGGPVTALSKELATYTVNLFSPCDGLDLTTPAGRLLVNVAGRVGAHENEVSANGS